MATVTADQAADSYPVHGGVAGNVCCAWGTYEIASALSKNDIIEFCKLPKGAVILGGWLYGDDIDTGTETLQIDIGTASDPDMLLDSGVITGDVVTGVMPVAGILYQFQQKLQTDGPQEMAADTTIIGTITAVAAGGGTGTVSVVVLYTMAVTTL